MTLKLNHPLIITSRLHPGLKVGENSFISIQAESLSTRGRYRWRYWIDTPDFEYTQADIETTSCIVQDALSTLLSFLGAAAEAYRAEMNGRMSDNSDLFGPRVMEWAYQNADWLSMLSIELEEMNPESEDL